VRETDQWHRISGVIGRILLLGNKEDAMTLLYRLLYKLSQLFGQRHDPDLEAEIQEHLGLLAEHYVRQGMARDAAMRAARRQFGNITRVREERQMMQTIPVLETLARDVRQSARSLRKSPSFTAAVVLTLAVGIGANTAIFSICNAVLLKPLPYAAPQTLVMLWERMGPADRLIQVAPANFRDWREHLRSFATVAALNPNSSFVLSGAGEPGRLIGAAVSWDFFAMLGTQPVIGRTFVADEGQTGHNQVAVLSYATWIDRFGARPDVAGSTVTFNDATYIVVGVLPREFELVGRPSDNGNRSRFDVFVPYVLGESPSRGTHPSHPIGRRSGAAHLIEVLSADGKSRGTGIVTAPVAAHSVPRWSRTM